MAYLIVLVWALAAYVISHIVRHVLRERYYANEASRLGCEPAVRQPNAWPLGLNHIRDGLAADKARTFPDFAVLRYARCGNKTHEYNILGTRGFLTCDPKNIQAILATQFKEFAFGEYRLGVLRPLLGNGIFAADGAQWERARAMMRPQFARGQVSDLELEEEHLQNLLRALPCDHATGWTAPVDLQVLFFRLTIDSACQFLFGESIDSQLLNLPENVQAAERRAPKDVEEARFARAFDSAQAWCATRARAQDFYWLIDGSAFRKDNKIVHDFVDHFVRIALSKRRKDVDSEKTFSQEKEGRYLFLDALAAETQDPIELRYQLVNILLAGRDTTAGALGWAFYTLARRPDIWQKLRATVIHDFGTWDNSAALSFETLKGCTYLQHFIQETLRLWPVVPINTRRSLRATTLPTGGGPDGKSPLYVRPNTNIDYSVHVMHRLEEYWGPDAKEFNPERFASRRPGWEYLPFNGGPRICLGQQFALTEMSYVMVRLLQRFDGIENLDFSPETHRLTLTSCPGNGVKVKLHAAPN